MSTYKPTEEQLFNFYLRETDPVESQEIREYLKDHPDDAEVLDEYHRVISTFRTFPLESPAEDVLESVRRQARVHLKKSVWHTLSQVLFVRQRVVYGVAMVLVLAVGLYVSALRTGSQQEFAIVTKSASNTSAGGKDSEVLATHKNQDLVTAGTGTFLGTMPHATLTAEQIADLNLKYAQAKDLMTKSLYIEAATIFENIMITSPRFDRRIELYSNWIECLDKTGQKEVAKTRRQELAKILQETKIF